MAVHKSKKSRSCRGMRRSHSALSQPTLAVDAGTGEVHRRHHVSPKGYYKGKEIIKQKVEAEQDSDEG